jgi:hypothetical protein
MREHEGKRLCLECKIHKDKKSSSGGTARPVNSIRQTGSIKVNKDGQFSGWDSIFT